MSVNVTEASRSNVREITARISTQLASLGCKCSPQSLLSLSWPQLETLLITIFTHEQPEIASFISQRESDRQRERIHPTPTSLASSRDREALYRRLLIQLLQSHIYSVGFLRTFDPTTIDILNELPLLLAILGFLTDRVCAPDKDSDNKSPFSSPGMKELPEKRVEKKKDIVTDKRLKKTSPDQNSTVTNTTASADAKRKNTAKSIKKKDDLSMSKLKEREERKKAEEEMMKLMMKEENERKLQRQKKKVEENSTQHRNRVHEGSDNSSHRLIANQRNKAPEVLSVLSETRREENSKTEKTPIRSTSPTSTIPNHQIEQEVYEEEEHLSSHNSRTHHIQSYPIDDSVLDSTKSYSIRPSTSSSSSSLTSSPPLTARRPYQLSQLAPRSPPSPSYIFSDAPRTSNADLLKEVSQLRKENSMLKSELSESKSQIAFITSPNNSLTPDSRYLLLLKHQLYQTQRHLSLNKANIVNVREIMSQTKFIIKTLMQIEIKVKERENENMTEANNKGNNKQKRFLTPLYVQIITMRERIENSLAQLEEADRNTKMMRNHSLTQEENQKEGKNEWNEKTQHTNILSMYNSNSDSSFSTNSSSISGSLRDNSRPNTSASLLSRPEWQS